MPRILASQVPPMFEPLEPRQLFAAVSVDAGSVLRDTSDHPVGVNLNYLMDDDATHERERNLAPSLRALNAKFLRYPGGDKSDNYLWSNSPWTASAPTLADANTWPGGGEFVSPTGAWYIDPLDFDKFITRCREVGAEPVVVVPHDIYFNGNAATRPTRAQLLEVARQWVRYANVTKGYNVRYWEIGNETYFHQTAANYATDVVDWAAAMKAEDPTIRIGANGDANAWYQTLLQNAGPSIDFLSHHYYPGWSWTSFSNYQGVGDLSAGYNVPHNAIQNYAAPADKARIKVAITETGPLSDGSWVSGANLGLGMFSFDLMATSATKPNLLFVQLWNTRWVDNANLDPNGNYDRNDALRMSGQLTAVGQGVSLLGRFMLDKMVASSNPSNTLRAFATHSPGTGKLNLFVINKSTSAQTIDATLQNYLPATTARKWVLTGASSSDKNPTLVSVGNVAISGGVLSSGVDPVSITVFEIDPGNTQLDKVHGRNFGLGAANQPTGYERAYDGNTATHAASTTANGVYTGVDLGSLGTRAVKKVRFFPRPGFESAMVGGKIQGSNTSPTSGFTDLATVTAAPAAGWNELTVTNTAAWRYLRYLGPDGSYGHIAEMEFFASDAVTAAPSAPNSLAAAARPRAVRITWNDTSRVETHFVLERQANGGAWSVLASNLGPDSRGYTDRTAADGVTYAYRVKAVNAIGSSAYAATAAVSTIPATAIVPAATFAADPGTNIANAFDGNPATSYGHSAASGGYVGVDLGAGNTRVVKFVHFAPRTDWATAANGGKIQGSNTSPTSGYVDLLTLDRLPVNGWNTYTLPNTTAYRYLRYLGADNKWCALGDLQFLTEVAPAAPASLSAVAISGTQVNLSWKDQSNNESGFRIERAPDVNGSPGTWTQIASPGANATSYASGSLSPYTRYHYRVRAYNSAGNSAFTASALALTQANLTTGLNNNWRFDSNLADSGAAPANGAALGSPTYDTADKKVGSASLVLSGSNQGVSIPSLNTGNLFTVSAWIKRDSSTADVQTILANSAAGKTANGFRLLTYNTTASDARVLFETGDGTAGIELASPTGSLTLNAWQLVTVTVDRAAGTGRIYINGVDTNATGSVKTNFNTTGPLRAGMLIDATWPFAFKGKLDDLRLYSRSLPAGEVAALHAAASSTVTQAESATLGGGAVSESTNAGFNGAGYVNFNSSGGFLEFAHNAPSAGAYTLVFRYAFSGTPRNLAWAVNGVNQPGGLTFTGTGSNTAWGWLTLTVNLAAGLNTFRLTSTGQDGPNLDEITIL